MNDFKRYYLEDIEVIFNTIRLIESGGTEKFLTQDFIGFA